MEWSENEQPPALTQRSGRNNPNSSAAALLLTGGGFFVIGAAIHQPIFTQAEEATGLTSGPHRTSRPLPDKALAGRLG